MENNKYNNLFELLDECSEKLSSTVSRKFIEDGVKLGLDSEYKITIKKCTNRDGYSVSISCHHRGKAITLRHISGLSL